MGVGDKIKFDSERCRYTIQAMNERFIIATKPFNAQKTYLYTIVDRERKVRGPINLIFGPMCDVDSPEGAQECLDDMMADGSEVSHRHYMPLTASETERLGWR